MCQNVSLQLMFSYLYTVSRKPTQSAQSAYFTGHKDLVIIESESHVAKYCRVVRAQRNRYPIIHQRGEWMHRH